MSKKLKILIASSEVSPFAKTGGLADVTGALPMFLSDLGHDVRVITPKYKVTDIKKFKLKNIVSVFDVSISNRLKSSSILEGKINGKIPVYFIKNDDYYNRDELYGTPAGDYPDNGERFVYFAKAVLEACKKLDFKPDVIHCNDWQTGLIPVYLKKLYRDDSFLQGIASVCTVHNLGYQGLFPQHNMSLTDLSWDIFTPDGIEFYGMINLLKGGLVFADVINTVSKKYSQEIQTEEYGYGLDGVLRSRNEDLYGILNGVDYNEWNPSCDRFIAQNYGIEDLSGKKKCKKDLLKEFGLTFADGVPVIGIVSRLADQKGFDLLAEIVDKMICLNLQIVLLGTGMEKYQDLFKKIGKKYPKKIGVEIGYNNALAHKIEAGADMFLMPSKYEPCGLNQIYSLKYGTIPIVRATGGLDDTIKNFSFKTFQGNGFKFKEYSSLKLLNTVKKAVNAYSDKNIWHRLMKNAMSADFSWDRSAKEYVKLYKKAVEKAKLAL